MTINKNFSGSSILLIGAVLIALTVVTYILMSIGVERTDIDKAALAFLLLSEVVLTAGTYLTLGRSMPGSPIMLRTAIPTVLFLYFFATLLCTLAKNAFDNHYYIFVLVNVFLIAPTIILIVLFSAFAGRIKSLDDSVQASMQFMLETEKQLSVIKVDPANSAYAGALNDLYETARYADHTGSTSKDADIFAATEQLEKLLAGEPQAAAADVEASISKVKFLIKQRATELVQSKRGGF